MITGVKCGGILNTILSPQEEKWLLEQRVTRLTDNREVLIYPMGAERYLSSVLSGHKKGRYNINAVIEGKHVLVIPGYGNSAFLFAQTGAKKVTVYDKDPVTIAWVKAYKKYYHYKGGKGYPTIGELLTALTSWYPPLIRLPTGLFKNMLRFAINPKSLRRTYIYYLLSLVRHAIEYQIKGQFELEKDIQFYTGDIHHLVENKKQLVFDAAFVPYLLGVRNGIERAEDIINFIKHLTKIVPNGPIVVIPARNTKEFHFIGQRYFQTTGYANIQHISGLEDCVIAADNKWFNTQGLVVFARRKP